MNYQPRPTQNRVVCFRSRVRNLIHRHQPEGGWDSYVPSGSLKTFSIPGDHGSALRQRWGPAFVATLRQALDAVDAETDA